MKMQPRSRALDKIYKRRDRYEIPDWQREEVWKPAKKRKLIDTILRDWKLPKFYFLKTSDTPEEFEVLDGQQRLVAIWDFFDGTLSLSTETAAEFGGSTYNDLPDAVSDAFDDFEIDFDEITDASEEDQKEFFQRLQEGLPLSSSEKLNSVPSKLRDYCMRLAKHKFFADATSVSSRRYAYFDICAKVLSLEIEGLDAGTRYEDVKAVFQQQKEFSGNSAIARRVKKAIELLTKVLPNSKAQLRNRTIVQSVISFTCHLLNAGMKDAQYTEVGQFLVKFLDELTRQVELGQKATDKDYLEFQRTVNANVRTGPLTRNSILLRKLFAYSPGFYSNHLQTAKISEGLDAQIHELSTSIKGSVVAVNEKYAATHGKDLIKPTNKTLQALSTVIQERATNFEEYKRLIENLYFLFWEGVGQRLQDDVPESFKDINSLRTLNEHDIDHGKGGRVAKKRKELSKVFEKYSGESSPETMDPEKFAVVQVNTLSAISSDLYLLVKKEF